MSSDADLERRILRYLNMHPGGREASQIAQAVLGPAANAQQWDANLRRIKEVCDELVEEEKLEYKLGSDDYYGIPDWIERNVGHQS